MTETHEPLTTDLMCNAILVNVIAKMIYLNYMGDANCQSSEAWGSTMSRVFGFILAFVVPLVSLSGEPMENRVESQLPPDVDLFLRWLPQDTEAVVVSQQRFQIRLDDQAEYAFQRLPTHAYLFLGLNRGGLWDNLRDATIDIAVSGMRGFHDSADGGHKLSVRCDILRLDRDSADAVQQAFMACIKVADREDELAGQKVGVFTVKARIELGNQEWTLFLANPKPAILICGTDRLYVQRVLRRMDGNGAGRALPESLPEWQHVDLKAPIWAVRHYRKDVALRDPTSPLASKSKANVPDPQAVGFVFWYDANLGAANAVTVRYLSNASDTMRIVKEGWVREKEGLIPKMSQVAPEVVEVCSPNGDGDGWKPFFRNLLTYCGTTVIR